MNDRIYTISEFIECKSKSLGKIEAVDAMIDALELKLLESIDSANYSEYQLDDGQMKVRTAYRSTAEVLNGINELEKLKQRYVNRYNGRTLTLRSGNL
jgi:hypothetical protein